MSQNFISDLTNALKRIITPDDSLLKDILIVGGMPEKTENVRYLSFNRQVVSEGSQTLEFSAVVMINNRRVDFWKLEGYKKKLSEMIFHTRWTRNPLDLFLNALRCDTELMDILGDCSARYTLMGILRIDEIKKSGVVKRLIRRIRPCVIIPELPEQELNKVIEFENRNEIVKSRIKGVGIYRKIEN